MSEKDSALEIRPLSVHTGAEISGIDISTGLSYAETMAGADGGLSTLQSGEPIITL